MSMELLPWADEEQELLGEALSLLADWEDGASASGADLSPLAAPGDARRVPSEGDSRDAHPAAKSAGVSQRPVKINLSRERQKQEIRDLQECVVELEGEITRLKAKDLKRPRADRQHSPRSSSSALTVVDSSVAAWENAARRQFRARKKAEMVNMRLREMMATQMGVAQDLMRVIQRAERARQEAQDMALFPIHAPPFAMEDPVNDQRLQLRLMKISAEWHVPFTKCAKFHDQPGRSRELLFHDVVTTFNDVDELIMDVGASTPMTFARQAVEDVLWGYFLKLRCTEDDFSLATESREAVDTLVGCLRASASDDGIIGVLDSRFMKQRFRNVDGELVIATTLCGRPDLTSTRQGSSDQQLTKIEAILFEDSWLRVLHVEDSQASMNSATASTGLTVIQHVRRSRIQFCGLVKPDRAQVTAVEKFMTRLAVNELRWGQEVLDRSLMLASSSGIR